MKRGVIFICWGERKGIVERAMSSLQDHHPELPVHVVDLGADGRLIDKARMMDLSPFEETLFLDADTVVLGDLTFGFEKAQRHGVACCVCECPWARRYPTVSGDVVEYNTGVVFFTKAAKPLFDAWKALAQTLPSSSQFYQNGKLEVFEENDQASFAVAMEQLSYSPFVLPLNWNFRPRWHNTFWGSIKVWHDYSDVPPNIRNWSLQQSRTKIVQCANLT